MGQDIHRTATEKTSRKPHRGFFVQITQWLVTVSNVLKTKVKFQSQVENTATIELLPYKLKEGILNHIDPEPPKEAKTDSATTKNGAHFTAPSDREKSFLSDIDPEVFLGTIDDPPRSLNR